MNNMKKTQQTTKNSFKGLVNIENEKLPEKKSRSRSIRDRNNTTNQFSVSRTTEIDNKPVNSGNQHSARPNIHISQGKINFDDNYSNLSRNESSMEKVRENLRKQSDEIKSRERNRSHSRRRRSNTPSKDNSLSHVVNRFPNPLTRQNGYGLPQNEENAEKQLMNQIINIKNQVNEVQKSHSAIYHQLGLSTGKNPSNSLKQSSTSLLCEQRQTQLKQKAEDLNNILQTFHINFKENLNKTGKEIFAKIDSIQNNSSSKQNQKQNYQEINKNLDQEDQINSIFNRIQAQYHIGHNKISNSQGSLFQEMKRDGRISFSDFQKRLQLAQQRLLK